jgi:rare lipoprotein A
LPTIAKVTNLSNGRSIVVVIDDRGPYKNNRIIDLSVSAARELDMYHKGVGKVCVQALPRESEAFSAFLKQNCGKFGTKTEGLTWAEIYAKNIGGKNGCAKLTTVSNRVRSLNDLDKQRKQNTIDEQRKIRELLARADDNELSARARRNRNTSNLRDRIVVKRTVVSK